MGKAFTSIAQGLREALDHQHGKGAGAKVHRPEEIDVAALRKGLGLTQTEFAAKFCISLGTLRHWERGDRRPHGPALALLHIVAKEPKAVLRALAWLSAPVGWSETQPIIWMKGLHPHPTLSQRERGKIHSWEGFHERWRDSSLFHSSE